MGTDGEKLSVVTGVSEDKYECDWKIENFMKVCKDEKLVESQKFEIQTGKNSPLSTKWVVGLKNVMVDGVRFYHVYCKLVEKFSRIESPEYQSSFGVTFKRPSGSVFWTQELQGSVNIGETFQLSERCWWKDSTNWTEFLDSTGALTLYIKISLFKPLISPYSPDDTYILEQNFRLESLKTAQQNLALLLVADSSEFDVKFVCNDGREFKCHTAILKANSDVFKSMLQPGFSEEKTGVIKVKDISGKTMEVVLQYLYTGELLPTWSDADVIVEFTYAAGKYQLSQLLEYLDNMLRTTKEAGLSSKLLALLDLANKLSLKKAEAQLMERYVQLAISSKSTADILSVFRNEN